MIEAKNGFTGNVISAEEQVIYKNMINLRQLVQIYITRIRHKENNQELVVNKNKLVSIIIYWDINKYIKK